MAARGDPGATYDQAGATLLWGLTTTRADATECERGIQSVETYFPWWGYIVAPLTVGLVVPVRKQYTCMAAPPTAPGARAAR